ncbi:MAG TPA: glycosyltransferase [Chloroflexota bacterium]|nr:glycosyltransferase [Chloroflexota bacterium]
MKVALVHDYLYVYGGAERTLEQVHQIWPTAPIYTLFFVRERLPNSFSRMDIRTTWVDRLPARLRLQRLYAMLQPLAFRRLRLGDADTVLSFASFGAKAVIPPAGGRHICYCYTPPRFLWGPFSGIERARLARPVRLASRALEASLRRWDYAAAQRVDRFITQSRYVAARIQRVYRRDAEVIPPPVDVERFAGITPRDGGYFLVVSRFEAYKRIDLAIQACARLRLPLHIVGSGVDEARLRRLAADAPTVRFLGALPDAAVVEQLAGCRAFLFPGEEDFGLTAVEAQAAGKPVIAYAEGGALETVLPGTTGEYFSPLTVDALAGVLATFRPQHYDPAAARANAARFAPQHFRERMRAAVERDAPRAAVGATA